MSHAEDLLPDLLSDRSHVDSTKTVLHCYTVSDRQILSSYRYKNSIQDHLQTALKYLSALDIP